MQEELVIMSTHIKITKYLIVFLIAFTLLPVSTFLDLGQGVAYAGRVTKAKKKAITKARKLPRHNSSIISLGHITLATPSLNWKTGEVESVLFNEGSIKICGDKSWCYQETSSRREFFDGRPVRHNHSLKPEATSEVISLTYKSKYFVGAKFADPAYKNSTHEIRSDFTYLERGSILSVGVWYQTDTQRTKALKRWEKMHKIMARYSSNAKASRRAKLGEILGIVGKAVDAFN